MNQYFRQLLFVFAIFCMASSSFAHAISPQHEVNECSVCIFQPNLDLQVSTSPAKFQQLEFVSTTRLLGKHSFNSFEKHPYFHCRAPPIIH